VKKNICDFSGTLELKKTFKQKQSDFPAISQGVLIGTYHLSENKNQHGAGIFSGIFISHWYIDSTNSIHYDSLSFVGDGFHNNSFYGQWKGYHSNTEKKCNWGDCRIPFSDELDCGVAEFFPAEKWSKYGWENYIKAYSGDDSTARAARGIEESPWWK